ncbi:MAG TPA: RNA pyrophosphohydrolase [Rhodospirillaceae bacterium]|nr:RNA pyrophosphohydrolase [Rhodospirillaceae bacterium]
MKEPTSYRSGVGIVLINRHGQVFAGRRRDGRAPPWQMPQGGIGPDENPDLAVFRELQEELGTRKADILEVFPRWVRYDYPEGSKSKRAQLYRGQQHLWYLLLFTGRNRHICIDTPHAEFDDWQWVSPPAMIDLVVPFKRAAYREVLGYFASTIYTRVMPPAMMFTRSPTQPKAVGIPSDPDQYQIHFGS